MFTETYAAWLRSITQCCGEDEKSRQSIEKPIVVLRDQPGLVPPPSAEPVWADERHDMRRKSSRSRKRSSSRGSFSGRRRWYSSSRRPLISAPTNFRHVYSESFQFPGSELQFRPTSFHPIELDLQQDTNLSSILPMFDSVQGAPVTPPPPAHIHSNWDSSSTTLTHQKSFSSTMSFHLPRRPVHDDSSLSTSTNSSPPRIPPRSHARARAYTSPNLEGIYERVASAMIEKERLEAEIESVLERQSLYISSRPSTAYGMQDLEPMPSIPALPAAAPSFAERLSSEARPRTAPPQAFYPSSNSPWEAPQPPAPANNSSSNSNTTPLVSPSSYSRVRTDSSPTRFRDTYLDRPLAPPLPLVLRPPLRKKKSFSRVSNWLFPGVDQDQQYQHLREMSLDSITNQPLPVTDRDGFYQCVGPAMSRRDSVSSFSTWESEKDRQHNNDEEEDEDEEKQTVPTTTWSPTWSPASSPALKQYEITPRQSPIIERRQVFAISAVQAPESSESTLTPPEMSPSGHRPQSVGVAF